MRRGIFLTLAVIGVLGFMCPFYLPHSGTWLDHVELPTFFETSTIVLPDGGRLAATMPTQRVQRYGSDGRFQMGWFVPAKGGVFAIGMTRDGKVAVCTARGREILRYELDGRPLGDPRPCFGPPGLIPRILQPADFPGVEVELRPAVGAERPNASLLAILMVPIWHPFVAWWMIAIGLVGLRFGSPAVKKLSRA
jgi:hypothetical protein